MAVKIIDFEDDEWMRHIHGDWILTSEGELPAQDGVNTLRTPPMSETGTRISYLDMSKLLDDNQGGVVSFYYRKSTYGSHNIFYVNDSVTGGYGNEVSWAQEKIDVALSNRDVIEFRFFRNINIVKGEDAVFIDKIEIEILTSENKRINGGQILKVSDYGGIPNPGALLQDGTTSIVVGMPQKAFRVADFMFGSGSSPVSASGVFPVPEHRGTIAGTVLDIQAQPISRRVRVHERTTGRIAREGWSDADGKYRFTDLDPRRAFYVMAFDHTLQQNAVVSDNVYPELEGTP